MTGKRPVWLGEDQHTWDHVRIHLQLIEDERVTPFEISTWLAIAYKANLKTGNAISSHQTLASLAKCSPRRVRDAISNLKDWGYLETEDRDGQASKYTLLSPPPRQELPRQEVPTPPPTPAGGAGGSAGGAGGSAGGAAPSIQEPVTRTSYKIKSIKSSATPSDLPRFEDFWQEFPKQKNGTKPELKQAKAQWDRLKPDERARALASLPNYQRHLEQNEFLSPKHAFRYLRDRSFEAFAVKPLELVSGLHSVTDEELEHQARKLVARAGL